jgi:hypothetical protein
MDIREVVGVNGLEGLYGVERDRLVVKKRIKLL